MNSVHNASSTQEATSILSLPLDLINKIYQLSQPPDAYSLAMTCKSLRGCYIDDLAQKQLMEAHFHSTPTWLQMEQIPASRLYQQLSFAKSSQPFIKNITLLQGHQGVVFCLQMSADGRRALSGSGDHTLKLWDLETGECLQILQGHTEWVKNLQMSADEKCALSLDAHGNFKLWDLETGECLRTFQGSRDWRFGIWLLKVQISPDWTRALSRSDDHTLKLWDLETAECLQILQGHSSAVKALQISPDGRRALSGDVSGVIKVWDLETGRCLLDLEGHLTEIQSIQMSADGRRALSGDVSGVIKLWDLEIGCCLQSLHTDDHGARALQMSADGRRALSGGKDGIMKFWDLETGRCLWDLKLHENWVSCLAISDDGTRVISGDVRGTLKFFDLAPLPENAIYQAALKVLQKDPLAQSSFDLLPEFVKQSCENSLASEKNAELLLRSAYASCSRSYKDAGFLPRESSYSDLTAVINTEPSPASWPQAMKAIKQRYPVEPS